MSSLLPVPGLPPKDRLEFETLISDTSADLMAAPLDRIAPAIETALDRVRRFFEADRCGLLNVSADGQASHVAVASYVDGVAQVSVDVNLVDLFPWASRKLLVERVPVIFYRTADLPPDSEVDRATFHLLGIRSHMAAPIFTGPTVSHVIVIHWVNREWHFPDIYVPRLRVLGELMVNALHRKKAFDDLQASEERLGRAAAAGGCGLWDLDVASGKIWVTPETRQIYGLTPDESATYVRFAALLHPDDRDGVTAKLATALESDDTFDEHYRIVRDDGVERWIHAIGRRNGHSRLLGASVDVTSHVRANETLRDHAARVAAAVETAELGFSEWRVGEASPFLDARMRDLLGIGAEDDEQVPVLWLSRVHPDDREGLRERRQRLLTGEVDHAAMEYRYQHPRRGWVWLRHTSRRLEDVTAGGGRVRVIGAVQDITDRRVREEELKTALDEVKRLRDQLQSENLYLRQETERHFGAKEVGGRSPAIRLALGLVEQVAPTNATVLLTGETGTGKERFATLIHEASPRRSRPMVRVNCSAIPTALIESELFGREKGAYTGALTRQAGRFEVADGSTLFLDEVSDLPLEVQVKLLRVLQERTIERLGSPRPVSVDVRIIAATNHDLEQAVREGRFRSDLFYRLNVFPIQVPSLRDRREDIPALVAALVEEIGAAMGKRFDSVSKASLEAIQRYSWPGNVRELRNVVERAMILAPGPTLRIDLTATPSMLSIQEPDASATRLVDVEREHILRVLADTGWRIKGPDSASVRLGMKPSTLYCRLKKLGIERPSSSS